MFRFQENQQKHMETYKYLQPHERRLGEWPTSGPNNSKNSELTRVLNNSVGTLPHKVVKACNSPPAS